MIEKLIEKLNYYKDYQANLEQEKKIQLGDLEQKVLEYRLALSKQLEEEVEKYSNDLHNQFEEEFIKDSKKVENYIELLETLIKEQSIETEEEGEVNE